MLMLVLMLVLLLVLVLVLVLGSEAGGAEQGACFYRGSAYAEATARQVARMSRIIGESGERAEKRETAKRGDGETAKGGNGDGLLLLLLLLLLLILMDPRGSKKG